MSFISLLLWKLLEITCTTEGKYHAISVTCSLSSCEAAVPQNVQYHIIYSHAMCFQMRCDTHLQSDLTPKPLRWGKGYITNSASQTTHCNFHWRQHTLGQPDFHGQDTVRGSLKVTPNCCPSICMRPSQGSLPCLVTIKDCSSTKTSCSICPDCSMQCSLKRRLQSAIKNHLCLQKVTLL